MSNPLTQKSWSPYAVGAAIGVLSWFSFASANHPLGVSTAFEHTAALGEKAVVPEVAQRNDYFPDKEAQDKSPRIGWEWTLVLGVFIGALVSARLSGDQTTESISPLWRWRFGDSKAVRYTAAFFGAALMMFGARLAQGCTSGHGISGALQLAVSSWIFVVVLFSVGTLTAFLLYGTEGRNHV